MRGHASKLVCPPQDGAHHILWWRHQHSIALNQPAVQQIAQFLAPLLITWHDQQFRQFLYSDIHGGIAQTGWQRDRLNVGIDAHLIQYIKGMNVTGWITSIISMKMLPEECG